MRYLILFALLLNISVSVSAAVAKTVEMKLYVFECGRITVKDISMFSPGFDRGIEKELTNSCYLIQHNNDYLMWDTGLNDATVDNNPEDAFALLVTDPLLQQLADIGVKAADINYLALSHAHFDHTGNANAFINARLIVQQEEFNTMFVDTNTAFLAKQHFDRLNQEKALIINGDYDVFGDGRVVVKRAVGHTPGHQVLYVNLPQQGPILLSGDLYHFTKNRKHGRVPVFNVSQEDSLNAITDIESFVKESGAQLWIQHDKEQNEKIRHSPAFYR